MNTVSIRDIHNEKVAPQTALTLSGWVRTHRQSKNISFIELSDGTAVKGLQLVIQPTLESYVGVAEKIGTGASITARGMLAASPAKGQKFEFQVEEITLHGIADPESYPLQKKGHSLEFLRDNLHLRPRTNTFGAIFRVRSHIAFAIHEFFQKRGFVYLTSPIVTTSDCEGAGQMFRVTTLDPVAPPRVSSGCDFAQDFFGEKASLTVSGQLEAETFATALSRTYTFGPTFRAENSNTTRHLAEFWMVEPEMAFAGLEENMQIAEAFIKHLIGSAFEHCRPELEFLEASEWGTKGHLGFLEGVMNSKCAVLDYTEAIKVLEKCGKKFDYPVKWGIDLQSEHERYLTAEYIKGPVFVINYPREIKSFYMRVNEDGKTVRAMDLLCPGIGEIIGGSQREERLDVLRERMKECNLPEEPYQWYLDLRRYGTVPHAGFGLGFERFLVYLTGFTNIRDMIPFPRYPRFAKF